MNNALLTYSRKIKHAVKQQIIQMRSGHLVLDIAEGYHYLAFVEQIPQDSAVFIAGIGDMGKWALRLLQLRGYEAEGFIADVPYESPTFAAKPVLTRDEFNELDFGDTAPVVLVASPHKSHLIHKFVQRRRSPDHYIFDVTMLYQFVTSFAYNNETDILMDDLAIAYWRATPEEVQRAGETWRKTKKLPVDKYVRNIEKAKGKGSRYVVNIGSHDGISGDPCYPLYKDGWKGWAVDGVGEESDVGKAARRNLNFKGVSLTLGTLVTSQNVVPLLTAHAAPYDCDLIKVDIDSFDGAVIEALVKGGWKPRVFCVEVNADFPPPFTFKLPEQELSGAINFVELGLYGCSAAWAAELLERHGFTFAQYEFGYPSLIGGIRDMIFIRNDVFEASGAVRLNWQDAYYAEPLGWSHMRATLKINPRDWRHTKDAEALLPEMRQTLTSLWKEKLAREADIEFELGIYAPPPA